MRAVWAKIGSFGVSLLILAGATKSKDFYFVGFTMTPSPRLQYVIRNKQAIGFLLSAGPKGYRAFDRDGRPIGLFDSEERAVKAVYEQAAP